MPALREGLRKLRVASGPPEPLPTSDPFELILWENVAYMASPARRREAFDDLRRTIGTTPDAILEAPPATLRKITARGILKEMFAEKLRACATIAMEKFGGDLGAVVRKPAKEAIKALRLFPKIGEPGAEKILLFSGRRPFLAPDSNALRVLVRLGLIPDDPSYARTYAAARNVELPTGIRALQEAHLLLQRHGQTLCKTNTPKCGACPLESDCPYPRRAGRATARRKPANR